MFKWERMERYKQQEEENIQEELNLQYKRWLDETSGITSLELNRMTAAKAQQQYQDGLNRLMLNYNIPCITLKLYNGDEIKFNNQLFSSYPFVR